MCCIRHKVSLIFCDDTNVPNQTNNLCGPVVRRLRMLQGMTQKELAVKCQVLGSELERDAIAKIENGTRLVRDTELVLLAAVLGSSPNELTSGRANRPNPAP